MKKSLFFVQPRWFVIKKVFFSHILIKRNKYTQLPNCDLYCIFLQLPLDVNINDHLLTNQIQLYQCMSYYMLVRKSMMFCILKILNNFVRLVLISDTSNKRKVITLLTKFTSGTKAERSRHCDINVSQTRKTDIYVITNVCPTQPDREVDVINLPQTDKQIW